MLCRRAMEKILHKVIQYQKKLKNEVKLKGKKNELASQRKRESGHRKLNGAIYLS